MGLGLKANQIHLKCLCFGCVCGHLEEEEVEHHVQVKSFGNKFHIGDCCTWIRPVKDPDHISDEEDQTTEDL